MDASSDPRPISLPAVPEANVFELMAGKMVVVRELPLRSEPIGLRYGFAIGDRYQTTLPDQDEARAALRKVLNAVTAAIEPIERWASDKYQQATRRSNANEDY